MLYYLGKGTEFRKDECKEYKTIEGALRAAAKDETLTVWDENGKVAGGLADNAPGEGAEIAEDGQNEAKPEKSTMEAETGENGANTEPEKGGQDSEDGSGQLGEQKAPGEGTEMAGDGQNEAEPEKSTPEVEKGENGANTEPMKPKENNVIIPQETMRVTVICDGTLNLRRSADWGNGNICGRASRGQSYYVEAIHNVQGKKMIQTIDGIYLSGQPEHVKFEQL